MPPRPAPGAAGPIRVLVVDDEPLVRAGLTTILSAADDVEVVAATDGRGAISTAQAHRVDVVLCDLRMPGVDGLAVLQALRRSERPPRVAMLTTFAADDLVAAALRAGASGYLLKDTDPDLLVEHVRALALGRSVLDAQVSHTVIDGYLATRPGSAETAAVARLSPREREVLAEVARGAVNEEIAGRLVISVATVKDHVGAILAKLGVDNRVKAALVAVRAGFDPGDPLGPTRG